MKKAPSHLTAETRRLFSQITDEYDLAPAELKTLQAALEAWDRAKAARERIDAEGMVVLDRFAQGKAHPLLTVERDARSQFLTGMKHLGLDGADEPARAPGRPTDFERIAR